jgi:hypothetical protein
MTSQKTLRLKQYRYLKSNTLQSKVKSTAKKITGGGSSVSGAVVGGLLAGGAGAVIGSREKVESQLIRHDEREVLFNFF